MPDHTPIAPSWRPAVALCVIVAACEPSLSPPPIAAPDASDATKAGDAGDATTAPTPDYPDAVPCRELVADVTVRGPTDLELLAAVRRLDGNLAFRTPQGVWNGELRAVGGDLVIGGTATAPLSAMISLTSLLRVEGDLRVEHTRRGLLDLGRVRVIDGSLGGSDGRWTIYLGLLESVGGDVDLHDARLDALASDRLAEVAGALRLQRLSGLTRLDLPSLSTLGSGFGDALVLTDNPDLAAISFGALWRVDGDLAITGNGALARAAIDAALARVAVTGRRVICGNADDEACP